MNLHLDSLCDIAMLAAQQAGGIVRAHRGQPLNVEHKNSGDSEASQVVTEVDRQAQSAIISVLESSLRQYDLGLLAEESADDGSRLQKQAFWCVDPLDGTLAFTRNVSGCSVSIALVSRQGIPLIGVVYDPDDGSLYHATRDGGTFRNHETLIRPAADYSRPLLMLADLSFRHHEYLKQTRQGLEKIASDLGFPGIRIDYRIGAVMKAIEVLKDANACYFKYPRTANSGGSIWDYAASSCLLKEAGLLACDIYGTALDLNRQASTFLDNRGVIFCADQRLRDRILALYEDLK